MTTPPAQPPVPELLLRALGDLQCSSHCKSALITLLSIINRKHEKNGACPAVQGAWGSFVPWCSLQDLQVPTPDGNVEREDLERRAPWAS